MFAVPPKRKSKAIEKVVAKQLNDYINDDNISAVFPSAYSNCSYRGLYNNQITAGALIGQSSRVCSAGKLMKKSRVFQIIM